MYKISDEEKLKWYEYVQFTITDFFQDWIYPGYKVRNLVKNRYDLVRLKQIKASEYSDVEYRMFLANMELIKYFVEVENPEDHVCWYCDEKGNEVGHKYGECKDAVMLYPELKGKWILDIIKDIYDWYVHRFPELTDDNNYIASIWSDYFYDSWTEPCNDVDPDTNEKLYKYISEDKVYSKEELEKLDIDWKRIYKYTNGEKDITIIGTADYLQKLNNELDKRSFNEKQYYLHLCIEMRPYLWT